MLVFVLRILNFLINPKVDKKDIYIVIVSTMLDLSAKGVFSTHQFCAIGHFYDEKQHKLGGKQQLVTTDGRESCMFINDRLDYIPVRFPNDEEMESYPKVPLNPSGKWNPSDLDDDCQWDDSDYNSSFGVKVYSTSYT